MAANEGSMCSGLRSPHRRYRAAYLFRPAISAVNLEKLDNFSYLVDGCFVLNRSVWVTLWSIDSWYNVLGTALATESTRTDNEDTKLSRKNLLLGFVEHVHCKFKISDLKMPGV